MIRTRMSKLRCRRDLHDALERTKLTADDLKGCGNAQVGGARRAAFDSREKTAYVDYVLKLNATPWLEPSKSPTCSTTADLRRVTFGR